MSWLKLGAICKQVLALPATGVDEASRQCGGQKQVAGGVLEGTRGTGLEATRLKGTNSRVIFIKHLTPNVPHSVAEKSASQAAGWSPHALTQCVRSDQSRPVLASQVV